MLACGAKCRRLYCGAAGRQVLAVDLLHLVERLHPVELAAIVVDHQRPALLCLVRCDGQASVGQCHRSGCSAPVDAVRLRCSA